MRTGDILRSAKVDTLFEGRVPTVVLDLCKDFRAIVKSNSKPTATRLMRESVQRYYDSLLWSREKDEWNLVMTESEKLSFIDAFHSRLFESSDLSTGVAPSKEFKVKNTIDCELYGESMTVSYNACKRSKRNVDIFNTINEDSWLDLDEVIDEQGINILDDLSEGERREIVDQCWDDADELIELNARTAR